MEIVSQRQSETSLVVGSFTPRDDGIQHAALGSALNSSGVAAGFFNGVLDEARIWNYARTQSQLQATINSDITSGSGLLGRWGLNEGSGTTAGNSIVTGPNGTLTNGPVRLSPGAAFNIMVPPLIIIDGTPLTAFTSQPGIPSAMQSYTVLGSNLTEDIVITAPADFELSTILGGDYDPSITLLHTGGSIAATTIYVRFKRATAGVSSGDITHTSAGATTQNVPVSGTEASTMSTLIPHKIEVRLIE